MIRSVAGPMATCVEDCTLVLRALLVPRMWAADPLTPPVPWRPELYARGAWSSPAGSRQQAWRHRLRLCVGKLGIRSQSTQCVRRCRLLACRRVRRRWLVRSTCIHSSTCCCSGTRPSECVPWVSTGDCLFDSGKCTPRKRYAAHSTAPRFEPFPGARRAVHVAADALRAAGVDGRPRTQMW